MAMRWQYAVVLAAFVFRWASQLSLVDLDCGDNGCVGDSAAFDSFPASQVAYCSSRHPNHDGIYCDGDLVDLAFGDAGFCRSVR